MDFDKSLASAQAKLEQVRLVFKRMSLGEAVSGIELDLAKNNMIQLYEQLLNLRHEGSLIAEPANPVEVKKQAEPAARSKKEIPAAPPDDPVIILSKTSEEVLMIEPEIPDERPDIKEGRGKSHGKTPEIVAEKFHEKKKVMNETLTDRARPGQKDISSVLQNKPIHTIESAIGINDKFLFIKELFNGNAEQYKETLELLNNTTDFNTAVQYVEQRFNWDMESEAVMKLLDLLRRRYISNSHG